MSSAKRTLLIFPCLRISTKSFSCMRLRVRWAFTRVISSKRLMAAWSASSSCSRWSIMSRSSTSRKILSKSRSCCVFLVVCDSLLYATLLSVYPAAMLISMVPIIIPT